MISVSINKRILQEVSSQTDDPEIEELAKILLQFEMENWKMERVRFSEFYEKQIDLRCRKRLESSK